MPGFSWESNRDEVKERGTASHVRLPTDFALVLDPNKWPGQPCDKKRAVAFLPSSSSSPSLFTLALTMKPVLSLAALSLLSGALAQFTMNTPSNPVTCQPLQLTWTGGAPPYFISVQDGNNPSGDALIRFPEQNGTSLTWTVNIQPNTSIGFLARDNNGQTSQTAAVTTQAGSSTSCVSQSLSISGGGSNTAGTGAGSPTTGGSNTATNTGTGTSGTSASTTGTGTNRPTTGSSSAGASETSNAASATGAHVGAAGVIGAALLALLA
ncbi:hypothetical protein VNI00_005088 [Paramarasmius palmivorus]|uniref:Uncharacterized protein n=1 Tax=Paramarasmius palmivorus TaxID=297713 RepID=A0AAW0DEJ5_9AGAR